jgi:hypothetical protein
LARFAAQHDFGGNVTESTELTVIERAAIALGADEGEKQLIALAKKYTDITDIKNPAGRTQCHAAAMELSNARIHVDKTGKAAREDANAFQKAVIAEVARRVAIIKPEEDRLLAIRDKWDEEREAERQAKLAAEAARIAFIRKRIGEIQAIPSESVGRSAADLAATIELTEMLEITLAEFMELSGECEVVKSIALGKLREMHTAQLAAEEAAAEAARQAAAERIERERVAEANRIEAKRLADLAADLKRQEEAARAKQAEADRIAREQREAAEAEQRAANERAAAAMRQQQAEHEARMREQQAELDRKQAAIDAAIAEQERIAREAREAAAAAAKLEADHAEALIENDRIDAERAAAQEAVRVWAEKQAAEQERIRREQIQFEQNGPEPTEIIAVLADHYNVSPGVVRHWLGLRFWAQEEKAA